MDWPHAAVPVRDRRERLGTGAIEIHQLDRKVAPLRLADPGRMLAEQGLRVAYSTLTDFCRRHGIGTREQRRAGQYHFAPGEEMQHDTSPHTVRIGDQRAWSSVLPWYCATRG